MRQSVNDYVNQLLAAAPSPAALRETADILKAVPELSESLSNPAESLEKRCDVIDRVFPTELRVFLKGICRDESADLLPEILAVYAERKPEQSAAVTAELQYVTAPSDKQLAGFNRFIEQRFGAKAQNLFLRENPELKSGFKLTVNGEEFDWSEAGRIRQLKARLDAAAKRAVSEENIISILKGEVADFNLAAEGNEIGTASYVGDGIVHVDGIDHAMYGEIVIFDDGTKAMVQDIKEDGIGCILFGKEDGIGEGSRCVRTGKQAGIPVGEGFLGRVIDPLGAPIDGNGPIREDGYRPIEEPAPGIIDRSPVNQPMETGILAIDSMFPIGRGQRELIIGDRQTGKTSIATDTIINQKGKGVVCIYVAIGQKASTVAKLVNSFRQAGALDYTCVLSATAAQPAPLQYIAPYAGTALAEYFMHKGKDVLIVYDDLSKHAVAYRALSLLLERSPGREAYPGDVFYLHSRLLERSSRLNEAAGGGSITALPIIETQEGDVSAYIPTNVISITDGQIFLETDLFASGQRPAVNVGLSVSRVGGAAQTKAMKKAAGSIRIDLAQYREMQVFTQFSSDLDDVTKEQLAYGNGLMQLLKQPLGHPFSMAEQVVTLCAATHKVFIPVPLAKVGAFRTALLEFFHNQHPEILQELTEKEKLEDALAEQIAALSAGYRDQYLKEQAAPSSQLAGSAGSAASSAASGISAEQGTQQS